MRSIIRLAMGYANLTKSFHLRIWQKNVRHLFLRSDWCLISLKWNGIGLNFLQSGVYGRNGCQKWMHVILSYRRILEFLIIQFFYMMLLHPPLPAAMGVPHFCVFTLVRYKVLLLQLVRRVICGADLFYFPG